MYSMLATVNKPTFCSAYSSAHRDQGEFYWRPGQSLPLSNESEVLAPDTPDREHYQMDQMDQPGLTAVLERLNRTMEDNTSQLEALCSKVSGVEDRMAALEDRQTKVEEEMKTAQVIPTTTDTPTSSQSGQKRKRSTPLALQVC